MIFRGCSSLTDLDLSHFDTSNIQNISNIFRDCSKLKFVNLSNWDNPKIIRMNAMFGFCSSLTSIDLTNFNTAKVKDMNHMFWNCTSLVSLDLSSFNTNQVTNMGYMFCYCSSLISLNITHFNTSNVENIERMFYYCISLTSLDISNFHSKYIKYSRSMFKGCSNLSYINMSNYIEYSSNVSIYTTLFSNINNTLIICIQKNQTPIITDLVNEIRCATIYCGEDLFRIRKKFDIDKNKCTTVCPEELPFEIISIEQCYNNCQIDLILKGDCKLNFEENKNNKNKESTKAQDIMLRNVEFSFISDEYDTSNLDGGNEEIIKDEIMQITLTTTEKQKDNYNNSNNMSSIDLGDCENLLRKKYNISNEQILYMRKIDVYQKGMKIPKVEFDIYYKENNNKLKKLNLTICENSNIYISYPIEISENIDIYNPKSDYYNNICYPATSNSGTDIILNDRQKEFVEENRTICQDGCDFEKYDNINKRSKCSCKGKEFKSTINSIADIKINKNKLFKNFIDVNNIINIQIIKCYKILFSKEGIINNIAFYLIIPIIILHIISIFLFYAYHKKEIFDKIKEIIYAIINKHSIADIKKQINKNKLKQKYQKQNIIKNKKELIKINQKKIINNNIIQNNVFIKNKNIFNTINDNMNINKSNNKENIREKEKLKRNKLLTNLNSDYLSNKFNKKHQKSNPIKKTKKEIMKSKFTKKINNIKETDNSNRYILNSKNKEEMIEDKNKIMEYNDKEMNEFSYEQALKYDKRNYIQYYCSLLKTKYILIFSFYTSNDFNSKIIKIDLFFIGFVANYAINALFFNDDNMHKIYEDHGAFDILYQLPQIIYSYLISAIFDSLFNLLALSEDDIIMFKRIRNNTNLNEIAKSLKNKLNIKFALYFIISMIFLLCFWYYLSIFCAIYRNTQYHLLKDTLISFSISLITPLGLYLLPGVCRIPSLSGKINNRSFLFNFSKLFQML